MEAFLKLMYVVMEIFHDEDENSDCKFACAQYDIEEASLIN
jgi:hypothetical protein